jgi:hypothetical protein
MSERRRPSNLAEQLDALVAATEKRDAERRSNRMELVGFVVVVSLIIGLCILAYRALNPPPTPPASEPTITSQSEPLPFNERCAKSQTTTRPPTGFRISPDRRISGLSTLEITNGLPIDAAVRLVDTSTKKASRFVYIRAMTSYKLQKIEPGTYSLRYASGLDWAPACREFLHANTISEFPDKTFKEGYETTAKATLHPVPLGNVQTKNIDKKRFLEGDQNVSARQTSSSQP